MSSASVAAVPAEPVLDGRKIFTFLCMVFGMFMAILDIQIVSASLPEIQAGLGASQDDIAWVQTAYLIAEVIMIPLSGYLSRMLSTRWMFALAAGGFTLMSLMCATATTIEEMIVWRALQGFIGGGMIPTVFASAYLIFPRSKFSLVSPLIGLVATLAPTIGPTLGGYLTELGSWHWLFLINVIPGIFVTIAAISLIDFDEPDWSLFDRFDWVGFIAMAVFLGSMEFVLEEGAGDDWFQSEEILLFTLACGTAGVIFFWRVFTAEEPVVDLSAFKNKNFAMGSLFSFTMGIGLYGLTYLYPVYLSAVRDYSSLQIGETMFVTGAAMFLTAPIAGRLMSILDPRIMMGIGFAGFALGTWMVTGLTHDWDFWELFVPQILRGVSLMICMVPINNIALGMLPPHMIKNASGLFNLTRNLGGAVGLAVIGTVLTKREDFHYARLGESLNWARSTVMETKAMMDHAYSSLGQAADTASLKALSGIVTRESFVMAFADIFMILTMLFLTLLVALFFVEKPKMVGGGGGGH
ncbi:DHA2 family efflux MFS transporter permease subunit [Roseibium sp. CAU 1637]|uniref:DHA2 family efflux MFS transporter permease subunit n=1 Tax=Roseibium limicola TaxID=2816037 RepID=A0A939J835_9HYPH|nr:DHA2 family efflux MFS transporter permease subunit [Roseibium limicola]MBO0344454.1 DHA2 family efflux MFS transporter permease subunit [Roseibium limicola]